MRTFRLIGAIIIAMCVLSCKKGSPYAMKTGYYAVEDIRVYPNGSVDTLYYTAVGPNVSETGLSFTANVNNVYVANGFSLSPYKSSTMSGAGGPNNRWLFDINLIELGETFLHCYRISTYDSSVAGRFDNYITFTYIE